MLVLLKKMKIMWHIDPRQRKLYKKKYEDRLIYFYLLTEEGLDDSSVKADAFAYMIFKIKDNPNITTILD